MSLLHVHVPNAQELDYFKNYFFHRHAAQKTQRLSACHVLFSPDGQIDLGGTVQGCAPA